MVSRARELALLLGVMGWSSTSFAQVTGTTAPVGVDGSTDGPTILSAAHFVAPPDSPSPTPSSSYPSAVGVPGPVPLDSLPGAPSAISGSPSLAGRKQWSLGNDGPMSRFVAGDLYPAGQVTGWYAGVDLGIMKPNLKNNLTTPATYSGPTGNAIRLPQAPLDWAAVPLVSVGYRLGEAAGEFRLSYRLLASAGTTILPGLDPPIPAQLRSRLDVQTIDLDYITSEYKSEGNEISRFFFRDLRAGVGMRVASTFFDSHAVGTTITDTHVSSTFGGVGPRAFVELHQNLGLTGFQFYTRMTASGVLGPIRQTFTQTVQGPGGPNVGVFDTQNRNTGIGVLQLEAGFSWEPDQLARRVRLTAAYSWERWWNFGRTDDSNAELTLQGLLLRAEYRY